MRWSPTIDVKTSAPINIRTVSTTSWGFEKTSISTVDMLETVAAETEVKNRSKLLGSNTPWVLGLRLLRAQKPRAERETK